MAFAVTALFFGAMLPATVSSLDRLVDIERRSGALSVARSTLERYLAIARLDEGVFDGRQGGFTWRASITRILSDTLPTDLVVLREVRVEVATVTAQPLITLAAYRVGEVR